MVQPLAKFTVTDAALYGHGLTFTVQFEYLLKVLKRDLLFRRVCNIVERMSRAERPNFAATAYQFLYLLDGLGLMQSSSAICVIASPISWFSIHRVSPERELMKSCQP